MNKNKKLIIVGIGETALLAYEYFTYDSNYEVVAFSVNENYIKPENITSDLVKTNLEIVPLETIDEYYKPTEYEIFVAVSSSRLNRDRTKLYREVKRKGYKCATYISSHAFVWRNVEVGENCFIMENNVIQPFVKIGNNVVLWSGNHIGHRTVIKDNCFISSHCVISGFCEIGENCFLGVNCTIENNVKIAKDNFIGAGTLIRKDTREGEIYQNKQTEPSKVSSYKFFKIIDRDI